MPMGVPSATRPLASGGWDPHQTSVPSAAMPGGRGAPQAVVHSGFALVGSDARVRRNGARKGSVQVCCAFGGADDVDVVQVRCQQLPVTQVGSRLSERMVLPQCIQGWGQVGRPVRPLPLGGFGGAGQGRPANDIGRGGRTWHGRRGPAQVHACKGQ